jgi:hypothetical protein
MRLCNNYSVDIQDFLFIYTCLDSISDAGRNDLKKTISYLTALQDYPGVPVPDSICKEILQDL